MWKIAGVSIVGNLILGWLLLQAHEDIGAAISDCNADKVSESLEAEKAAREAEKTVFARELAARDRQIEIQIEARKALEAERLQALQGVETRDVRIRQLELEASIDDIPDSGECLNVYVLDSSVERMWSDQGCDQAGDSGSSANGVCSDSIRPTGDTRPGFARITYADALFAWNHDRNSLRNCNADKRAIAEIGE